MSKRNPTLYLEDILISIKRIQGYTTGLSFEEFSSNQQKIDAVVRNFEIIGEAARNVTEESKKKYPDVPWEKMVSMRNKVLHEYFGVDLEILWKTIQEDIPELEKLMVNLPKL